MTIDHELVLGLDREQALEKALRKGLGISNSNALSRCAEYIREPRHVAERRAELTKKTRAAGDGEVTTIRRVLMRTMISGPHVRR